MLERPLYEHYRIDLERMMNIGDDLVIEEKENTYLIRLFSSIDPKKTIEQTNMATFLSAQGEKDIAYPLKNIYGQESTMIDGQEAIVYQLNQYHNYKLRNDIPVEKSIGKRLAKFHVLGEGYEPTTSIWNGTWMTWKNRWMKRLDQLENWYVRKQQDPAKNEMDELFLLSFPYFLGITENAIQMLSDLPLNDPFSIREGRGNTVCHYRFHEGCWLTLDEKKVASLKVPTDFVYDHFSRDLAEYVRHICIADISFQKKIKRVETFLHRYQTIRPLRNLDIYLFLMRATFPVQYFEQMEAYYRTIDRQKSTLLEKDLTSLFMQTEEYEYLLAHLFQLFPSSKMYLPKWLSRK
ncbi:spore coat putative kinase YutH [Salipaludibacillus daqingensis]|uniref:spore coat putative kinase YutH n=1 Tax=Salipaludibacillus daqingensis TaxID=3041001 RepID=UPI002473A7E5|nr:spore coat protein YutH [Salipaludibacillus daqingensis]